MRRPEEAFVFVRRGEEWLVLHRSPRGGSYWHGVAGALEDGEDFPEAAKRELEEETGLVAEPVSIGEPVVYPVEGGPNVTVGPFLVEAPDGWEPTLDHEHDDYRWCSRAEALSLLHWPELRALLERL